MAIIPSDKEIEVTYKHALWLRGHNALNPESRMICDLGFEVQRLREKLQAMTERALLAENRLDHESDARTELEDSIRCITFDPAAQAAIPPEIRAKMDANRRQAEAEMDARKTPNQ